MPQTFLLIDSRDRIQNATQQTEPFIVAAALNQSLNDFVIQKRQPIITGYFNAIAVTEVRMPYISPNVNPYNNEFNLLRGELGINGKISTLFCQSTINIQTDFYTPQELRAQISTQINEADPNGAYSVSFNDKGYFIISSEAEDLPDPTANVSTFAIVPSYTQDRGGFTSVMNLTSFYSPGSNLSTINISSFAYTDVISGNWYPKMCYTDYIDVCSRQLTQYQTAKDNSTRDNQNPAILCRIYTGDDSHQNFGLGDDTANIWWPGCTTGQINKQFNHPKYSSWSPEAFIDQIDIQLRDDCGRLLFIPAFGEGAITEPPLNPYQGSGIDQTVNFQLTLHCVSENV